MRLLITGASGFLGQRLCRRIADAHSVLAIGRGAEPPAGLSSVGWLEQDLSRPLDVDRLPRRIDGVIHLAQSRRYREMPDGFLDVFRINTAATAELLDWARTAGAERFILASTGGVCAPQADPVSEATPPSPPGPYPMSKLLAEKLVGTFAPHLHTTILRYFFIYGPGQTDRLVPNLAQSVRDGRAVTLRGPGGLRFNPLYIADAVAATSAALTLDGQQLINVAGPEVINLRQLVDQIGAVLGREPLYTEQPTDGPQDLVAATEQMATLLGAPHTGVAEAVRNILGAHEPTV